MRVNVQRTVAVLLLLFACVAGLPAAARAQSATLAWDANPEPDVSGYKLHYGTSPRNYTVHVDVGKVTSYTVSSLDVSLDYYFAVQAYATSGLVSPMSAEVKLPAPVPPGTTTFRSFTASAAYPLLIGKPVTWTADAVSKRGLVEYRFMLYSAASGWTVAQDWAQVSSFTWTPGWNDIGSHYVQVWARTVGSPAMYEAWIGTNAFSVNAAPMQITSDVDFPTPPTQPVKWTAEVAGAGSVALEYRFVLLNQGTGVWSSIREWNTSNQAVWTPGAAGNYIVQVWARRVGSTAVYDVWGGTPSLKVAQTALQVSKISVDAEMPASTGTPITWTARVKGGQTGPVQYQFVRYSSKTGWQIVRPYSVSNTYTWTPGWGDEANYVMQVWARNAGSTALYDAWLGTDYFDIRRAPLHVTANTLFPVPPGTAVQWTADVPDKTASFEYQFWLYDRGTGTWSKARSYSTSKTFTWTPTAVGTYAFQVWARQVGSTADYDVWRSTDYLEVVSSPAKLISLTPSVSLPGKVGSPITWTAVGSGGTAAPLQYKFYLYSESTGWRLLRDWGTTNTYTWTPASGDVGQNALQVWIKSAGSAETYESWIGSGYFVIQP